jgi:hypothetical protein
VAVESALSYCCHGDCGHLDDVYHHVGLLVGRYAGCRGDRSFGSHACHFGHCDGSYIASVIAAIVAVIITSIPIVIVWIGSAIVEITSVRSTVPIVEALAAVPIVVVFALGLLGVE